MIKHLLLPMVLAAAAALPAHAELFVGTTTDNRLVTFDSANPGSFLSSVAITGLRASDGVTADPNAVLVNLSYNPADSFHYGLDSNANFYRVGLDGAATLVSSGFSPSGFAAGLAYDTFSGDFAFISDDAEVVLIDPSGTTIARPAIKYATGDANAAFTPAVFALSIDPDFGRAFVLDFQRGVLGEIIDPNFAEIFTVGSLGVSVVGFGGLGTDAEGNLFASLSTDGNSSSLYAINDDTGAATLIGAFQGAAGVNSFTAVPEPGTWVLLGLGAAVLLIARRRVRLS